MCYSIKNSSYRSSRYSGSVVDTVQKKGHDRDPQSCWQLPRWHLGQLVRSIVPPLYSCTFKPRTHIFMSMWSWKKSTQRCGMLLAGPLQGQMYCVLAKKLALPILSLKALLTLCISNKTRVRWEEASQKCSPWSTRKLTQSWLTHSMHWESDFGWVWDMGHFVRLLLSVIQMTINWDYKPHGWRCSSLVERSHSMH